jgi:predicted ATPase
MIDAADLRKAPPPIIKLQVELVNALMHTKGYAAPETEAAAEQARLLVDQVEALGEVPEDPLLLFSVLYGFWVASHVAFNGDVMRELATRFLALAQKQGTVAPLMIGHRIMATSLLLTGEVAESRAHYNRAFALYDPTEHRLLATRFGQDAGVSILSFRSLALWVLGCPEAALADAHNALRHAREIGHATSLMFALSPRTSFTHIQCGNHAAASAQTDELVAMADDKGALFWKAEGMILQGNVLQTGKVSDAVQVMTAGFTALRSTGATFWMPWHLSCLANAYAELGQFDDAWRCFGEAITAVETTKEKWCEAEVHRVAGEIALMLTEPDVPKAEAHFMRAIAVARRQQAKSWELRAAMSLARLWRDQGKPQQARELLAPVYGWFTEGFDTRDLKEAKALLEELAA